MRALGSAKERYRDSLTQLEKISEQIHEQRNESMKLLPPRTPGVGAEDDDDLPSINLGKNFYNYLVIILRLFIFTYFYM